jgi:hypothetical protein
MHPYLLPFQFLGFTLDELPDNSAFEDDIARFVEYCVWEVLKRCRRLGFTFGLWQ